MKRITTYIFPFVLFFWIASCSSSQPQIGPDRGNSIVTEGYTTAFPNRDISKALQRTQKSLLRIISTSYYDTYTFNRPIAKLADVRSSSLDKISSQQFSSEESTAGTSIILDMGEEGEALPTTVATPAGTNASANGSAKGAQSDAIGLTDPPVLIVGLIVLVAAGWFIRRRRDQNDF